MDEWRQERNGAYIIHCSLVEKPLAVTDLYPLPFDDELGTEKASTENLIEEYERLRKSGALD